MVTTAKTKYYSESQIRDRFDMLTKDQKISVLSGALTYMQQYNGRSRILCIAMAMGYDNDEGATTTYYKVKAL